MHRRIQKTGIAGLPRLYITSEVGGPIGPHRCAVASDRCPMSTTEEDATGDDRSKCSRVVYKDVIDIVMLIVVVWHCRANPVSGGSTAPAPREILSAPTIAWCRAVGDLGRTGTRDRRQRSSNTPSALKPRRCRFAAPGLWRSPGLSAATASVGIVRGTAPTDSDVSIPCAGSEPSQLRRCSVIGPGEGSFDLPRRAVKMNWLIRL